MTAAMMLPQVWNEDKNMARVVLSAATAGGGDAQGALFYNQTSIKQVRKSRIERSDGAAAGLMTVFSYNEHSEGVIWVRNIYNCSITNELLNYEQRRGQERQWAALQNLPSCNNVCLREIYG